MVPGAGLGLRLNKRWQPAVGAIFSSGHGNHGGAEVPLEGEDAHTHVEWKDRGSAGAGASWSGVWGPSPLRTGRSIPAQGLPTRGKGLRVEDLGLGEGTRPAGRGLDPQAGQWTPAGQEGGIHPERQRTNHTPACGLSRSPAPRHSGCLSTQGRWSTFHCRGRANVHPDPSAPVGVAPHTPGAPHFLSVQGLGAGAEQASEKLQASPNALASVGIYAFIENENEVRDTHK